MKVEGKQKWTTFSLLAKTIAANWALKLAICMLGPKKPKINRFVNVYNELSWPRTVAAAAANEARAMGWELCGIWWVRKAVKDG